MSPEAKRSSQDEVEVQMRNKILFKQIVDSKLSDNLVLDSATTRIRRERYRGGFTTLYVKDLKDDSVVFSIQEPWSMIEFAFTPDESGNIIRIINDGNRMFGFHTVNQEKDILDIEAELSRRHLSTEEVGELLNFMKYSSKYSKVGPPRLLVSVDPQEDILLKDNNLPTWNLPHER